MQEKIGSFVEIVGESRTMARQFLQATNWNLDEAVQLFYAQSDDNEYIQSRDQQSGPSSCQSNSSWSFLNDDDEIEISPPFELMFKGSFEQAKSEALCQGKWLIVNIQSTTDLNSYQLDMDTWANQLLDFTFRKHSL